MTKRTSIILVICIAILAMIPIMRKFLHLYRPVTKTDKWEAAVTSLGKTENVPVYKMAGFPSRVLVQLPSKLRQRYEWFGIYEPTVGQYQYGVNRLSGLKVFPYRHYNYDKAFGIGLDDPKTEDNWTIEQTDTMVEFYNTDLKIRVIKKH